MGHYFAHKIKRSLEVFHFPPLQRLSRIVIRKGVRRSTWRGVSLTLKLTIVILITFSLASPSVLTFMEISETVEIPMVMEKDVTGQVILAIDVSVSMGLRDVYPSRLEAAKDILVEFVQNSSDKVRFGVVAFQREVEEALPAMKDKSRVVSTIESLRAAEGLPCLEEFTDIGLGLQTCVDLLTPYASSNKSSAIILISDGFTNYGYPTPYESVVQAIARADDMGVPIHALHIALMGQDSNDELMEEIASRTRGKFFDSTNVEELRDVLNIIGRYYVPTHEWSAEVEIKTTIPTRNDLRFVVMFVAAALVLTLWIGNYRHYKTSF